jgi:hypothetical protein
MIPSPTEAGAQRLQSERALVVNSGQPIESGGSQNVSAGGPNMAQPAPGLACRRPRDHDPRSPAVRARRVSPSDPFRMITDAAVAYGLTTGAAQAREIGLIPWDPPEIVLDDGLETTIRPVVGGSP